MSPNFRVSLFRGEDHFVEGSNIATPWQGFMKMRI